MFGVLVLIVVFGLSFVEFVMDFEFMAMITALLLYLFHGLRFETCLSGLDFKLWVPSFSISVFCIVVVFLVVRCVFIIVNIDSCMFLIFVGDEARCLSV